VQLFWDIGLEIGHSIRTVEECLAESAADITVQTSLLEARLVTRQPAPVSCAAGTLQRRHGIRAPFPGQERSEMRQRQHQV